MHYIHCYEVRQEYGGPEEGGWWYDSGEPVEDWKLLMCEDAEQAYFVCRALNTAETVRAKEEEDYEYTSVLSYKSRHYAYTVEDTPMAEAYPKARPHYE
jgi:hypothetical protein